MPRHLTSVSVGALLALAAAGTFAQTTPPASGASAPSTLGVTPQDAARANQQAVPRSDTATVVRTAPSPASRASAAMDGTTDTASPDGMATGGSRAARADRN